MSELHAQRYNEMKKCLFVLLLFYCATLSAQDTLNDENKLRTHGISVHILGAPTWPIGITYSQMLNDRMVLHLAAGVLSSGIS